MKFLRYLLPATLSLLIATNVGSQDLKKKATDKISAFKDGKINTLSNQISKSISSFAEEHFENMKYLDFNIDAQEYLKPTFSIMSVNEIIKIDNGTIFNQTSINTHDGDETINIGFGTRKLLNDNTLILGANAFYDHQLTESHERVGVGAEAISSMFDVRGNYYNALSARRTNSEGTIERALDGWDLRGDYHLPIDHDVNIFVSAFEFENPESVSSYKETGNKFGVDAKVGNFAIEAGYMDDNQENDAYFGNVKYVVNFGSDNQDHSSSNSKSLTDVSDQLYQPVKRENKIRVVKIDASGVVVGGF
ncbi:inverse autotransporter beta domain-containing protein [Pelagibacterales bacterium SAG-MED48]|nr:inverse autotransporter beta domain-containing protein [Pelagibacterales bacterium SAG-MED48]